MNLFEWSHLMRINRSSELWCVSEPSSAILTVGSFLYDYSIIFNLYGDG
jgi:hypothetical protein